jgi:hypothetical protein
VVFGLVGGTAWLLGSFYAAGYAMQNAIPDDEGSDDRELHDRRAAMATFLAFLGI